MHKGPADEPCVYCQLAERDERIDRLLKRPVDKKLQAELARLRAERDMAVSYMAKDRGTAQDSVLDFVQRRVKALQQGESDGLGK